MSDKEIRKTFMKIGAGDDVRVTKTVDDFIITVGAETISIQIEDAVEHGVGLLNADGKSIFEHKIVIGPQTLTFFAGAQTAAAQMYSEISLWRDEGLGLALAEDEAEKNDGLDTPAEEPLDVEQQRQSKASVFADKPGTGLRQRGNLLATLLLIAFAGVGLCAAAVTALDAHRRLEQIKTEVVEQKKALTGTASSIASKDAEIQRLHSIIASNVAEIESMRLLSRQQLQEAVGGNEKQAVESPKPKQPIPVVTQKPAQRPIKPAPTRKPVATPAPRAATKNQSAATPKPQADVGYVDVEALK